MAQILGALFAMQGDRPMSLVCVWTLSMQGAGDSTAGWENTVRRQLASTKNRVERIWVTAVVCRGGNSVSVSAEATAKQSRACVTAQAVWAISKFHWITNNDHLLSVLVHDRATRSPIVQTVQKLHVEVVKCPVYHPTLAPPGPPTRGGRHRRVRWGLR